MTKTQLAILWILGVLIVVVLGVLGWALSQARRPQASSPTALPEVAPPAAYRLPETPHSALNLYGQAEQAAQRWQADAALVSASASWSFVSLDDFSRASDWTFQFYSPSTQRVYVVNVNQAEVSPMREALSPYSLSTIAVDEWQVDSYQALNAWLNRGGGTFIERHPVVDVGIRLARPQDGAPMWTVFGLEGGGQATWIERVDAQGPQP
jgi:hypothetical protein